MKETVINGILVQWTPSTLRIEGEGDSETTFFNRIFPTDTVVEILEYLYEHGLTVEDVDIRDNCLVINNPDTPDAPVYTFGSKTEAAAAHELVDYFFFVKRGDEGYYDDDDDEDFDDDSEDFDDDSEDFDGSNDRDND